MLRFFKRNSLLLAAGSLLFIPVSFARGQATARIADGGTREVLVSIFIPSLPGLPFAAVVNTEWVRPLSDGTRITPRNHRQIARDTNGRIFQERRLLVPEGGEVESVLTQIEITDPSLHEQYICMPRELVCQLEAFYPLAPIVSPPVGVGQKKTSSPLEQKVSLGTQWMAGIETVGTRETVVIPPGKIGNNSAINTSSEYWYSQQLGLNTLSIREDPRFGMQKFYLSDIVMGEPDAKLFAPPAGSKILDLRNPAEVGSKDTPIK